MLAKQRSLSGSAGGGSRSLTYPGVAVEVECVALALMRGDMWTRPYLQLLRLPLDPPACARGFLEIAVPQIEEHRPRLL